jgi:hypothetical protein
VSEIERNSKYLSLASMDIVKAIIGLPALTPEINCDQTAMGLSPVTSAVYLVAD